MPRFLRVGHLAFVIVDAGQAKVDKGKEVDAAILEREDFGEVEQKELMIIYL